MVALLLAVCLLAVVIVPASAAEPAETEQDETQTSYACPVCGTRLNTGSFENGGTYTQVVSQCSNYSYAHTHIAQDMWYGQKCSSCGYADVEYRYTVSICPNSYSGSKAELEGLSIETVLAAAAQNVSPQNVVQKLLDQVSK